MKENKELMGMQLHNYQKKGRKKGNQIVIVKPYECHYRQQIEYQMNTRNRTCGSNFFFCHSWNKNGNLKH